MKLSTYIDGVGWWASRVPSWEAALRGQVLDTALPRPNCALLAPAERRRAPDSVALALEVASHACYAAGLDRGSLTAFFASTHGDLAVCDYTCETLAKDPSALSPIKFSNSVHNAAVGYWMIATGNTEASSATSAGESTFAQGLLDAVVWVAAEQRACLSVAYDIEARGPLALQSPSLGLLGHGLVLAPTRSARSVARLDLRIAQGTPSPAQGALAEAVRGNALAHSAVFFSALARLNPGAQAACLLCFGPGQVLECTLHGLAPSMAQ